MAASGSVASLSSGPFHRFPRPRPREPSPATRNPQRALDPAANPNSGRRLAPSSGTFWDTATSPQACDETSTFLSRKRSLWDRPDAAALDYCLPAHSPRPKRSPSGPRIGLIRTPNAPAEARSHPNRHRPGNPLSHKLRFRGTNLKNRSHGLRLRFPQPGCGSQRTRRQSPQSPQRAVARSPATMPRRASPATCTISTRT